MPGTTITIGTTAGYYLDSTVSNPVTISPGVTITNVNNPAVWSGPSDSTYWAVANHGTLQASGQNGVSDGVLLAGSGGGAVTNMAEGLIAGYYVGVSIPGNGTVVNQGKITTANISGSGYSYVGGDFTTTTAGVLLGGGSVNNAAAGLITSYLEGVAVRGGGSVVNAGTISASSGKNGFGVVLQAGGSVTNSAGGLISAPFMAVASFGAGSAVVNDGVIFAAKNLGVALFAGGTMSNSSTGQISGFYEESMPTDRRFSTITNSGVYLWVFPERGRG